MTEQTEQTHGKCGFMCGGSSASKLADANIHEIVLKVKPEAEEKAGRTYEVFTALSYTTQVVSGTNYFVKVDVGKSQHVHLRIYQKLPCNGGGIELSKMLVDKNVEDPIEIF